MRWLVNAASRGQLPIAWGPKDHSDRHVEQSLPTLSDAAGLVLPKLASTQTQGCPKCDLASLFYGAHAGFGEMDRLSVCFGSPSARRHLQVNRLRAFAPPRSVPCGIKPPELSDCA
jgi:hypothetical protein